MLNYEWCLALRSVLGTSVVWPEQAKIITPLPSVHHCIDDKVKKIVQKVGYLLSPPTRRFFGDFESFVSHVILALFGSFGSCVIICALRWGIYCPLQHGAFLGIVGSFGSRVIICALRWGIYCPLQLTPPTWHFFGDFWKFCFAHNFLCPSFQSIYCPLQLAPPTRQFCGDFLEVLFCA